MAKIIYALNTLALLTLLASTPGFADAGKPPFDGLAWDRERIGHHIVSALLESDQPAELVLEPWILRSVIEEARRAPVSQVEFRAILTRPVSSEEVRPSLLYLTLPYNPEARTGAMQKILRQFRKANAIHNRDRYINELEPAQTLLADTLILLNLQRLLLQNADRMAPLIASALNLNDVIAMLISNQFARASDLIERVEFGRAYGRQRGTDSIATARRIKQNFIVALNTLFSERSEAYASDYFVVSHRTIVQRAMQVQHHFESILAAQSAPLDCSAILESRSLLD